MKVCVVIHEAEESGFWAEVPAPPGCCTEGETREELIRNLRDAVEGVLLGPDPIVPSENGGQVAEIEL